MIGTASLVPAAKVCEFDHGNFGIFAPFAGASLSDISRCLAQNGPVTRLRDSAKFRRGIARLNRLENDIAKMP